MGKALASVLLTEAKKEFVSVNNLFIYPKFVKPRREVFFMHELTTILLEIAPVVSLALLFQKDSRKLKLFIPFLFIRLFLELYAQNLAGRGIHNLWIINLITITAIPFYLSMIAIFIENKMAKRITFITSSLMVVSFIISCFFFVPIKQFHLIEFTIGSFLLLCACIYFFYELLSFPNDTALLKYPPFWIVTGLLFNYAGEFPVYLFFRFISSQTMLTVLSIRFMLDFLLAILNLLLIISFLCRINLRKRSLSFS